MNWLKSLPSSKVFQFVSLSAVVVLFFGPFVTSSGALPSDWDYFAQAYEAARKTMVEHHQFPWWNAWHMGGIPLYANPQFGLFSVQMLFVALFGTLTGLRITVLIYFLAGFWGMRQLLMKLGSDTWHATLLAYVWSFSAFPIWHLSVGHLTFVTYLLSPWIFYFLADIHARPRNWIYVAVVATVALQSSFHYTTLQLLMVATGFSLIGLHKQKRYYKLPTPALLLPYLKILILVVGLNVHKAYHTLSYLDDYPRLAAEGAGNPLGLLYASLTLRGDQAFDVAAWFGGSQYAWHEYAAYFGVITLALFAFLVISRFLMPLRLDRFWILVILALCAFILALGPFSRVSPYSLLKGLPGFEQMRVASRWLGWFVFFAILALHKLPKRKLVLALLLVSLADVVQSSFRVINRRYPSVAMEPPGRFNQAAYFINDPASEGKNLRLYRATRANIGEIYGYEPILGFDGGYSEERYDPLTLRCGINRGCGLVLTRNAEIKMWSPHKIILDRSGPGIIELNMNPGNRWTVNGQKVFRGMRTTELTVPFVIHDTSRRLIVEFE